MQQVDMIVYNIGELVTLAGQSSPRIGEQMRELAIIDDGAVAINQGKICCVAKKRQVLEEYQAKNMIDVGGKLVTPGLVDPHTHPVFAVTREEEFEMRVRGADYEEIAKAGGGIRNSVRKLRETPKEKLKELVRARLDRFLSFGVTTIEAKSGYGLSLEDEIKSLEILQELNKEHILDIIPTFLGAHEIPDEYQNDREGYIQLVIKEMIPEVARRKLARYCDIFCEEHVFSVEESRRILEAAQKAGMGLKLHADEFKPLGGAELAAALHAVSADHLVAISDNGIKAMQQAGVIAVLLPATTFFLGKFKYVPARSMIDQGLCVALSTDFNPGSSMTQSMTMAFTIAALYLKMLPAESLTAATINSACAIGEQERVGSIEQGKDGDLVIWNADNYRCLAYQFGDKLADTVIKRGEIVWES